MASATTPVPAGFQGVDLTFVSNADGWALGEIACPSRQQCAAVARTRDSGATWSGVNAPPAATTLDNGQIDCMHATPCIDGMRFGTATVGYAYGWALFHTVDGGQSWQAEPVSGPVRALEYAGTAAFRVLGTAGTLDCYGGCHLQRAASTGDVWRNSGPVLQSAGVLLAIEGGQRIYAVGIVNSAGGRQDKHAEYQISRDGGQTWKPRTDPCPGASYTEGIATAPTGQVLALCYNDASPNQASIIRSRDAGRTFGGATNVAVYSRLTTGNGSTISGLTTDGSVATSLDGGATWRATLHCQAMALGYQDGHTAHAICPQSTVARSSDAGANWTVSHF